MKTKKVIDFKSFITEKAKGKKPKNKAQFDKLIKELEQLNPEGNEDVKQAIAALKQEKDLKESPELIALLLKSLHESPETIIETINKYIEE